MDQNAVIIIGAVAIVAIFVGSWAAIIIGYKGWKRHKGGKCGGR